MSPCSLCGYNGAAKSFHHIDPTTKITSVGQMVSWGDPVELIEREIEKCSVLCLNCHYEVEHPERKEAADNRKL